jgi:hypothetical protein
MITSEFTRCDGAVVRVELPPPWFDCRSSDYQEKVVVEK